MNSLKHYAFLFVVFLCLFAGGMLGLERMESTKVVPFEHISMEIQSILVQGGLFYFLIFFPLTIILEQIPRRFAFINMALFPIVGYFLGKYIFFITYPEWVEVDGFPVKEETSMMLFSLVSLFYALVVLTKHKKKSPSSIVCRT
ncbi:hypothetical protein [Halalkalibacter urbisdiaboli]|uniref:hypothetical protein n=1 Tax=Halalkalibacter urbisdiaboli TaxID=1960589 RepID=UPI000B4426C6|nr:hypothetical protein [Halalkalibacter urbisdiaboli]